MSFKDLRFLTFKSISFKFILIVAVVLTLLMGAFAYLIIDIQRSQLITEVTRNAAHFSDTIIQITSKDMLALHREGVRDVIEAVGRQSGVKWVRIFNKEGKIMYSTDKTEMDSFVDKKAEACYACHAEENPLDRVPTNERARIFRLKPKFPPKENNRVLAMVTPIYNRENCWAADCHAHPPSQKVLGVLDIAQSLSPIDKEIEKLRTQMILFFSGMVVSLSFIIGLLFHRFLVMPIRKLVGGIKKVAAGTLEEPIPVESDDEIGYIAKSLNQMKERLTKTQEQLIRSHTLASMGTMSAGVAHEINNPLTTILSYSNLIAESVESESQIRSDIDMIVGEAMRCRELIQRLMEFSRPTLSFEDFANINDAIQKTLALVKNQVVFRNIVVEMELASHLPKVMISTNKVKQIFLNFLLNAAWAMPKGGKITIRTRRSDNDGFVTIDLQDTGCGIPPENIDKVFNPFFSTKKPGEGTGLGLAVSLEIIKLHGGVITVESEEGNGTKFTVKLPAERKGLIA